MLRRCVILLGIFLGACSQVELAPSAYLPQEAPLMTEPRGIVGELCPPALAAKGYC